MTKRKNDDDVSISVITSQHLTTYTKLTQYVLTVFLFTQMYHSEDISSDTIGHGESNLDMTASTWVALASFGLYHRLTEQIHLFIHSQLAPLLSRHILSLEVLFGDDDAQSQTESRRVLVL